MTEKPQQNPKPESRTDEFHGYRHALGFEEQVDYEKMAAIEGVDDEITLLRVKIKSTLEQQPEDIKTVLRITDILSKLIVARYNVTRPEKKGLTTAIKDVMKDIAVPIGIAVLKKKL